MSSFPQRLTKSIAGKASPLVDRIPGHIYLWLAIPIFGSSSAVTRKITEIGAQHLVGGRSAHPRSIYRGRGNFVGSIFRQGWHYISNQTPKKYRC
jgi:hypothetical protein